MKTLPLVGVCVTVTTVFSAYAKVHDPLAAALLSVHDSPPGALVSVPPPCDPSAAESVSVGGAVNCAVMLFVPPGVMVSVQVDALQAPEYPENELSPEGEALRVTTVFGGNVVTQVPLVTPFVTEQLMPDGILVTTPLPVPPPLSVMPCVWKIASAVRPSDITSWQGSEAQSPAQAANTAFPVVVCCSVTTVLAAKNAVQLPLVVVPLSTQLMPAG